MFLVETIHADDTPDTQEVIFKDELLKFYPWIEPLIGNDLISVIVTLEMSKVTITSLEEE